MATLIENRKWAYEFNLKIDKTLGNENLRTVFKNQSAIIYELSVLSGYVTKFISEHNHPSALDIAKAQRASFLRFVKSGLTIESLVLSDYLVFLEEAKVRMRECPEFREHCLRLQQSDLIPHQFTQSVLKFAALMIMDEE